MANTHANVHQNGKVIIFKFIFVYSQLTLWRISTGKTCSERVTKIAGDPFDQCQGQPCHNGGSCESGPGWFRCVCAQGFSGPDCRINVNECSPQPCLGGATCIDGIGGFTCICPKGRRGARCEIRELILIICFISIAFIQVLLSVLSDPTTVCLNSTSLSPYHSIAIESHSASADDEQSCNSCICDNGKPKCSNIWCGLKNCLKSNVTNICESNEVCVPALHETCLSPPCQPRGDCRLLERSRRVAPPKIPAPIECWPNQAVLDEQCARITILMDSKVIQTGTSVEGICFNLRMLVGTKLVKTVKDSHPPLLILLCDIQTGTNNTIEVTVVSITSNFSKRSS